MLDLVGNLKGLQAAQCSYFSYFFLYFQGFLFFLYFDPKSYIFPSNSYIFQNAADNNEISRKNHGILVMPVLMSLAFVFFLARFACNLINKFFFFIRLKQDNPVK